MIFLKNDNLSIEISELGAELKKITVNGEERLWNGDPAFWSGTAPLLFPICGGLPDDEFTYNGKAYRLSKHGFARRKSFTVEKQTDISATLLLKSDEETLKSYPWNFELRVAFTLRGGAIKIDYKIDNLSENTMYFSIGSHEAYYCPEGIEDYDIIFEKEETLNSHNVDGSLIGHSTSPIIKESKNLPLYNSYFEVDALVLKDVKSRYLTLRNRKNGKSVGLDFEGFDYLLVWTKPGAPFVCIEPWTGIPPMVDAGKDIAEKEGITALPSKESRTLSHTLYF